VRRVDRGLEVFCQSPISPNPSKEPFDDPTPRVNGEAYLVGIFAHDFGGD
jgi:hypothetical protein